MYVASEMPCVHNALELQIKPVYDSLMIRVMLVCRMCANTRGDLLLHDDSLGMIGDLAAFNEALVGSEVTVVIWPNVIAPC